MRSPLFTWLTITAFIILSVLLRLPGNSYAYASNNAIDDQVAAILFEESAQGKIKILILDFSASSADAEKKLSDKELKDRATQYTEEFIAILINTIKDAGKRDKISVIDRSRLDDILREKNLPRTTVPERTATEAGRLAGVDVIIAGKLQAAGNVITASAKVVRIKDGEILGIVKDNQEKPPSHIAHIPVTIIDEVEKINIGSYKALPLNLAAGGTLSVTIEVLHGNPIDINVIPGTDLDNFKDQKKFDNVADFMATKMKSYKRSAHLDNGDYYLALRDSSLGIFSDKSSEIKVMVQLEP